jgi:hypothetical protein
VDSHEQSRPYQEDGHLAVPDQEPRIDRYRDALETWAEWWNNVGRQHYSFYIVPPITATGDALRCLACCDVGEIEAGDSGLDRCQVCARRL